MSFSRHVDIIRRFPGNHRTRISAGNLIPLLHYRARSNPKLTWEANRSINAGDAEAAQRLL